MSVKLKSYIMSQANPKFRSLGVISNKIELMRVLLWVVTLSLVEFHFLSFKNLFSFLLCVCVYICISICYICVWVPHGGQKKVLSLLELEFQAFASLLTTVLGRAECGLNHEPSFQPAGVPLSLICLNSFQKFVI